MEAKKLQETSLYSRFHDVINSKHTDQRVVIFGCGSIGSYTALALFKMGFRNLTFIDYDIVEAENIGTQLFYESDIGEFKHHALPENLELMSNESQLGFISMEHKFEYDMAKDFMALNEICQGAIIVCAIDSMKAREWLFKLAPSMGALRFIDGRMAIEFLDVYSVNPNVPESAEKYRKTLFSDDDAVPMPCTNKSIGYTAMISGGVIGKMVKDVVTGKAENYQNFKFDINLLGGECM